METRDLIISGAVVGQLSMPDGTDEATWQAEFAKYTPKPEAIPDVTPRQMRQALVLSGVSMAGIDAAIAALPEPTKSMAQIEWEYSTMFLRTNPLVNMLGAQLGWSSAQLDGLWRLAKSL